MRWRVASVLLALVSVAAHAQVQTYPQYPYSRVQSGALAAGINTYRAANPQALNTVGANAVGGPSLQVDLPVGAANVSVGIPVPKAAISAAVGVKSDEQLAKEKAAAAQKEAQAPVEQQPKQPKMADLKGWPVVPPRN